MLQFLRITLGLFIAVTACTMLVISASWSAADWGCLRFVPTDRYGDGLLDVQRGTYFIERPSIPARYKSSVLWVPMNNDLMAYYILTQPDRSQRDGLVDYAHSYGYIDSGSSLGTSEDIYSISPDLKYLAFKSVNASPRTQSVIIRETASLNPVVSVKVEGNLKPRDISKYTVITDYPSDWSPSYDWLALTTYKQQASTLTLISPHTGQSQSVAISSGVPYRKIIWSPDGTSLAILGGGFFANSPVYMLYRKLDIVALKNGRWQIIRSYDTGIPAEEFSQGGLIDAAWSASDQAFSVLRLHPDQSFSVTTFHLQDTVTDSTVALPAATRPSFIFDGTWLCQPDSSSRHTLLLSLSSPPQSMTVDSDCLFLTSSPDKKIWLIKQLTPESPAGAWVAVYSSPFALTPLSIPSRVDTISAWTPDSRKALFLLPDASTSLNATDGQVGLIDITTGQWTVASGSVDITNLTISPDSSRYTVWTADMRELLLFDMENRLIASIPNNLARSNPTFVTLQWRPDSSAFMLTDTSSDGQPIVHILSGNGQLIRTLQRPSQVSLWLPQPWTRCEPSPKLPRLNLPS
ncbi:MAG: hypothetical protein KF716_00520 [Anaerolineae bacterium]|nr:hypothetical protein [Anaerolineae bacterium]